MCVCSSTKCENCCVVCHYLRTLRTVQKIRNHIVVHPEIVWESCDDEKATKREIYVRLKRVPIDRTDVKYDIDHVFLMMMMIVVESKNIVL